MYVTACRERRAVELGNSQYTEVGKGEREGEKASSHRIAGDLLQEVPVGSAADLQDPRELVDVVVAWEQDLPSEQLGHDAPDRPDVHLLVVVHPIQHDLRSPPVARGNIARHLVVCRAS